MDLSEILYGPFMITIRPLAGSRCDYLLKHKYYPILKSLLIIVHVESGTDAASLTKAWQSPTESCSFVSYIVLVLCDKIVLAE